MKTPKRKKITVPEIETDLSRIRQLSQEHDDENWKFRSWLKQSAPDNIVHIIKSAEPEILRPYRLHAVRKLLPVITNGIQEKQASHHCKNAWAIDKSISRNNLWSEGKVNPPCPMLNGKLCSIYETRPEVWRSFPHLEQPQIDVIENVAICPIAFSAFEDLKAKLGWTRCGSIQRRDLG